MAHAGPWIRWKYQKKEGRKQEQDQELLERGWDWPKSD